MKLFKLQPSQENTPYMLLKDDIEKTASELHAAYTNLQQVTEALSKYDEDFFSSKVLFVLNISMGSSGYNYVVEKVYETEEGLTFQLKQTTKGPTTADMSGMHILVEMDKSWDCNPENIRIEMV